MKVALVFGGRSHEHAVSIVSARTVARGLAEAGHDVVPMAIDRAGRWADAALSTSILRDSGDRADRIVAFTGTQRIHPDLMTGAVDIAFPVLHGPFGEDGTIQGLFEMLDLPYVGAGVGASALCMDKVRAKRLFRDEGLRTAPWFHVDGRDWNDDPEPVRARALDLGFPLFVKPPRMGSSVGITKVTEPDELGAAIGTALEYDTVALVERALSVREIEVSVLGNVDPEASVPGEVVPGDTFYSYDDKYINDGSQLIVPAPLDASAAETAQSLALAAYRLLGCAGLARVDLFLDRADGRFWINEVNTMPGFTSISMYPRLWAASGVPLSDLVDRLLHLALG